MAFDPDAYLQKKSGFNPDDYLKDSVFKKPGPIRKMWDDLETPEKMSREGLGMLSSGATKAQNWLANKTGLPIGTEPTGNMARDIAANTPRIIGEAVADVAPSFVSRGSIVTGGLLRGGAAAAQKLKPVAKTVAKTLENTTGLRNVPVKTPGLLTEAFEDPKLMFGMGAREAGQLYGDINNISPELAAIDKPRQFVKTALQMAKEGLVTTDDALMARRELDGIKDQVTVKFYGNARKVFDGIAKNDYSGADQAYKQGLKSDALRSLTAINQNGSPSVLRSWASLLNPKIATMFTPAIPAAGASALGAGYKALSAGAANPSVPAGIVGIIDKLTDKKDRPDPEFKKLNGKFLEKRGR